MLVSRAEKAKQAAEGKETKDPDLLEKSKRKLKQRDLTTDMVVSRLQKAELKEPTVIGKRKRSRKKCVLSIAEKIEISHKVLVG